MEAKGDVDDYNKSVDEDMAESGEGDMDESMGESGEDGESGEAEEEGEVSDDESDIEDDIHPDPK